MQTATTQQTKKVFEAGTIVFLIGLTIALSPFIINMLVNTVSENLKTTLIIIFLLGATITTIGGVIDASQQRRKKSLSLQS